MQKNPNLQQSMLGLLGAVGVCRCASYGSCRLQGCGAAHVLPFPTPDMEALRFLLLPHAPPSLAVPAGSLTGHAKELQGNPCSAFHREEVGEGRVQIRSVEGNAGVFPLKANSSQR